MSGDGPDQNPYGSVTVTFMKAPCAVPVPSFCRVSRLTCSVVGRTIVCGGLTVAQVVPFEEMYAAFKANYQSGLSTDASE